MNDKLTTWCAKMEHTVTYRNSKVEIGRARTPEYSPKLDHSSSSEIRKLLDRPPLKISENVCFSAKIINSVLQKHHKQYKLENKKKVRSKEGRLTKSGRSKFGNFYPNRPLSGRMSSPKKTSSSIDPPDIRSILEGPAPTPQQLCIPRTDMEARGLKQFSLGSLDEFIPNSEFTLYASASLEPSREARLSKALSSELRKLLESNETVKNHTEAKADRCNRSPTIYPVSADCVSVENYSPSVCNQPVFPSPVRVCEANDCIVTLDESEDLNDDLDPTLKRDGHFVSRALDRTCPYHVVMKR